MNIIDHRILIPAPQERVWQHISDLTLNPKWQTDCKEISILSTMKNGPGTRWRYTNTGGREFVLEATAWYDGLGYEYRFVDGSNFRNNKGLLRLQEVPEGTIVQWTFNYELGGLFSGLQNTLSTKRRVEADIVDSLRNLYRFVGKSMDNRVHQPKSLMRDAPDVEARAQYKPRHPSVLDESAPTTQISEPAIEKDDTRPNPVVSVADIAKTEPSTPPVTAPQPDTETMFKPPASTEPSVKSVQPEEAVQRQTDEYHAVEPTPNASTTPRVEFSSVTTPPTPSYTPPVDDTSDLDTGKISVFDVFGVPKPSETQEMRAVKPAPSEQAKAEDLAIESQSTTLAAAVDHENRIGLRLQLRRIKIPLRRPD